jgi:hypothetical protein
VDVVMTAAAGDECLAPPFCHDLHPGRFLVSAWSFEVGELANVMDLQIPCFPADLAAASDEPPN